MSAIITFRLDRRNPREAKALKILAAWQEAGHGTRHTLTEALLRLADEPADQLTGLVSEMEQVLDQAHALVASIRAQPARVVADAAPAARPLLPGFVESVRDAARPGISLDE